MLRHILQMQSGSKRKIKINHEPPLVIFCCTTLKIFLHKNTNFLYFIKKMQCDNRHLFYNLLYIHHISLTSFHVIQYRCL